MTARDCICLMGPTASGKTEFALKLAEALPVDIISVDSAMVYRGMDIGTAKPDPDTLRRFPHRLIDIRDPEASYSAGDFVRDAKREIEAIRSAGRRALLVGGTMMYFRSLTQGIAELPDADEELRAELDAEAAEIGWPAMHERLVAIDPEAARRINPNDSQRIQRALEVYLASGRTMTDWQAEGQREPGAREFAKIALVTSSRADLHARIESRLVAMLEQGFVDEVRRLMQRPGLTAASPAMRAVGYRQLWSYLEGRVGLEEATANALAATRQLAKRQLTWLRTEPDLRVVDPLESCAFEAISAAVAG